MNILQQIFIDHFEKMVYILHPRQAVIENVEKMIHCGDPSYGGALYKCPECGETKFVPFRCRSRFCPSCGVKYSMERTTNMSFKLADVTHRHCVFTIDENLRACFISSRIGETNLSPNSSINVTKLLNRKLKIHILNLTQIL